MSTTDRSGHPLPFLRWVVVVPGPLAATWLAVLLAACWAAVYTAGGTHTALPHLFYLPIILAVLPFRMLGAAVVAVMATLLCGPLMPLDVAAGTSQPVANWLLRGVFFVVIAVLAGTIVGWLHAAYREGLAGIIGRDVAGNDPDGDRDGPPGPAVTAQIEHVIAARRFRTVYQPIYALDDGRLIAVEALTRFDDEPDRSPEVWFALASHTQLGTELELATMVAALAGSTDLPPGVALSLNASPRTLADPRLLDLVDRHDRPLIVEVAEHALVDDYDLLSSAREQLRRRGIKVAVDDAGAGFASLRHIVRLAPDLIKLDHSLTHDLQLDPVREALAISLLHFASRTDSQVIAEGIEQTSDLLAWRRLGAFAAQGYLLAPPGHLPVPDHFDLATIRPWNRRSTPRPATP